MSENTNILVTPEDEERNGENVVAGATEILRNDDNFIDAAAGLDAERMEESAAMARLQQARDMTDHAMGTVTEFDTEGTEESAEMERLKLEMNLIDQLTGNIIAIFGGGKSGGNDSTPLSAARTLGIYEGAALTKMKQATNFAAGVNAPNTVTTETSLHWTMMGGTPTQQNTGVGVNGVGRAAVRLPVGRQAMDIQNTT